MTLLDGKEGFRIVSTVVRAGEPDVVTAISNNDKDMLIVFGGTDNPAVVMARSAILAGFVMQVLDSSIDLFQQLGPAKVGALDNDGVDDLGIATASGGAVIVYGAADTFPDSLNLAEPKRVALTSIHGMGDAYIRVDSHSLVALGDINSDDAHDLGIGWSNRSQESDIEQLGDINGDNIKDVVINGISSSRINLMHVVYGFPAEGFTGFLAATPNPKPISLVEESYFLAFENELAITVKYAIDTINDTISNGMDLGPTTNACLVNSRNDKNDRVVQFSCADAPLTMRYETTETYDSITHIEVGTAHFSSITYNDGTFEQLSFTSGPLSSRPGHDSPGTSLDKDVVRRILDIHYISDPSGGVPDVQWCHLQKG